MDPFETDADRLLLYNQDPGVAFSETDDPMEPRDVDRMVDDVATAGVDVLFVNVNMWCTNYPSDVWEPWWTGFDDWLAANPPIDTPAMHAQLHWSDPRHPKRIHMIEQMRRLADAGCDYLDLALDCCRDRGVAAGVSIRMNDLHDTDIESPYFSDWYRDHPALRLPTDRDSGIARLDWAKEGTRDHFHALIDEVLSAYGPDVLELDFMRHPPFFAPDDAREAAPTMTDFIARVADRCRRVDASLVPRVPPALPIATRYGLDVPAWVDRGIVDGVTVGTRMRIDWQLPLDRWRAALGDVPLFASLDKWTDDPPGLPKRELSAHDVLLAGAGAAYANTPADGLYFFNFFGPRERPDQPSEPRFETVPALASDDQLAGMEKHVLTTVTDGSRDHAPAQLPATIPRGIAKEFTISLAAEPEDAVVELRPVTRTPVDPDAIDCDVNDRPVAGPFATEPVHRPAYRDRDPAATAHHLIVSVDTDAIRAGPNHVAIRNRGADPLTLVGLEVHVR